jgi:hypothetical protein
MADERITDHPFTYWITGEEAAVPIVLGERCPECGARGDQHTQIRAARRVEVD